MRDLTKLKEKISFRLDNRHIFYIVVVSIVLVCTSFLLGVMVGKNYLRAESEKMQTQLNQCLKLEESQKKSKIINSKKGKIVTDTHHIDVSLDLEEDKQNQIVDPQEVALDMERAQMLLNHFTNRTATGKFTIQVTAFIQSQKDQAIGFARDLQKKGYDVYITEVDLQERGRWYRVRLGDFDSRPLAESFRLQFEQKEGLKTFVTKH